MLWKRQSCSFASFQLRALRRALIWKAIGIQQKPPYFHPSSLDNSRCLEQFPFNFTSQKPTIYLQKKTTNCYVFRALLVHLWVKTLTKYVRFPIKTSNSLGTSRQHCELEPFAPTPATTKLQTRYVPDFKTLWGTYAPFSWHVPS